MSGTQNIPFASTIVDLVRDAVAQSLDSPCQSASPVVLSFRRVSAVFEPRRDDLQAWAVNIRLTETNWRQELKELMEENLSSETMTWGLLVTYLCFLRDVHRQYRQTIPTLNDAFADVVAKILVNSVAVRNCFNGDPNGWGGFLDYCNMRLQNNQVRDAPRNTSTMTWGIGLAVAALLMLLVARSLWR